jgi:hypothetical protein
MATSVSTNYGNLISIQPTDCLGDSLAYINNNATLLGNVATQVDTNTANLNTINNGSSNNIATLGSLNLGSYFTTNGSNFPLQTQHVSTSVLTKINSKSLQYINYMALGITPRKLNSTFLLRANIMSNISYVTEFGFSQYVAGTPGGTPITTSNLVNFTPQPAGSTFSSPVANTLAMNYQNLGSVAPQNFFSPTSYEFEVSISYSNLNPLWFIPTACSCWAGTAYDLIINNRTGGASGVHDMVAPSSFSITELA